MLRRSRALAREHLCIRRPEYVAGTTERPEVGVFTQTHVGGKPIPWGQIAPGETVWMKWTGGPIVAKAVVAGFRQLTNCTPADLRQAVTGFGLHDLEQYWSSLAPRFGAVVIYLTDETWLDEPFDFEPSAESRRELDRLFEQRRAREVDDGTP